MDVPETVPTTAAALTEDQAEEHLRLGLIVDLDAGFAQVVRCHERVVYSVALRLAAAPADAEDLAAEAFLRAYRALRGYDAARIRELRMRPWLLTILRNTARNAARDAARRPGPPPAFEPPELAVAGPSVEQRVETELMQREWGRLLRPAARGPTGGGGAAPRRGPADQRDRADPRLPGRHREVARLARAHPAALAAGRHRNDPEEGNDDRSIPWWPRWAHCATPPHPPWTTSCSPAG